MVIKMDNKFVFTMREGKNSDPGVIRLSQLGDRANLVFEALAQNKLVTNPSSYATGILLTFVELAIVFIFLLVSDMPTAFNILIPSLFALYFVGMFVYKYSDNATTMKVSSCLMLPGLLCMSPSSLLLMPLWNAISENKAYKKIEPYLSDK